MSKQDWSLVFFAIASLFLSVTARTHSDFFGGFMVGAGGATLCVVAWKTVRARMKRA